MRRDPLIIGGGPAGAAAAITLARAGGRPVLIERGPGPADKVCGDFLSGDSVRLTRALGVDIQTLGAAPIRHVRLVHRERVAEAALPFTAFGLSRRSVDAALLRQAEATGAAVQSGQIVRSLTRNGALWIVETAGRATRTAETVFLATGKHDLRDWPRPRRDAGAVGMKTYLTLAPPAGRALDGTVELTLFPGGYAGMQPVEGDRAVLCVAVQTRAFRQYGGDWPGLIGAIERHSRRFASMLAGASPLLPRPLAVSGIPYGYRAMPSCPDGLFRLGDQAAVIPSLTGDGMAIALHSGHTAAETWLAGGNATAYQHVLSHTLAPQMRLAGLLHWACLHRSVQSAAVRVAWLLPALLRHAGRRTRLPPAAASPGFLSRPA